MEKVIIYSIELNDDNKTYYVEELKAFCVVFPHNGKKVYLMPYDEESISCYEDELESSGYYLHREAAFEKCFINNSPDEEESTFIEICKKFKEACEKYGHNPFFMEGENAIIERNIFFIEQIEDPILKHYLKSHFNVKLRRDHYIKPFV